MEKKPALWARIIGALVAFAVDNFWMLAAIAWFAFGDVAVGVLCVVMAFYERLTEIRNRIGSAPEVTLTLNSNQPLRLTGEEHF